ncbi:MAG: GlsB/YeaQ/YmgE family stress response membrane protein [Chloroflexi bacterium]|jgi:uncharacterized membrane protein YeaQ/YmgE (transglycosylase-associated protein family)|nr:GlsB/YeaQ/YmgE family stress response membrane protein [Chloroflexota bacterium]
MLWGIVSWLVIGALAGWVASLITGTNDRQGCLLDIVVGVVGAFIGGLIWQLLTGEPVAIGFNIGSFLIAVLGAVILLLIVNLIRGKR